MFVSEERRIVERIKDYINKDESFGYLYIMLRDGQIIDLDKYRNMVISDKINPQDAYVDIRANWLRNKAAFYYPFLTLDDEIPSAYLLKLGFHFLIFMAPATGLKYVAAISGYEKYVSSKKYLKYLSIEVVNLDTTVSNINLRKIVAKVLGTKLVSKEKKLTAEEFDKIYSMFKSQQLFAGYNFEEARNIIMNYYDKGNKSLTKKVTRIAIDYDRIFQPYRVCYETETWNKVDCWKIELD